MIPTHASTPRDTHGHQAADVVELGLGHRYRLDRLLARSTCGDIWRATWLQVGQPVMVKTLRPGTPAAEQEVHRQALMRESEHLRRLCDRHIVRFQRAGVWQGEPVLVLEQLAESLKDRLARAGGGQAAADAGQRPAGPGTVTPVEALAWVRQAAKALQVLHRSGRKHLDIKPANLLLTAPDAAGRQWLKLADFGVCLPITQAQHRFVGSPGWAAPEQSMPIGIDADGQPVVQTSEACDWYAVGQLLHRLVTGRLTPDGEAALRRFHDSGRSASAPAPTGSDGSADDLPTWLPPDREEAARAGRADMGQPGSARLRMARGEPADTRAAGAAANTRPGPRWQQLVQLLCSPVPHHRLRGAAMLLHDRFNAA